VLKRPLSLFLPRSLKYPSVARKRIKRAPADRQATRRDEERVLAAEGAAVFAKACELGLEGIMSKRAQRVFDQPLAVSFGCRRSGPSTG
jgi:hypothetical protein